MRYIVFSEGHGLSKLVVPLLPESFSNIICRILYVTKKNIICNAKDTNRGHSKKDLMKEMATLMQELQQNSRNRSSVVQRKVHRLYIINW